MAKEKESSIAQRMYGDFAPKLVRYTDDWLFGEVWVGKELSPRDRSIVTVTALVAGGHTEQLPFHLDRARENGVTEEEIVGIITHLAFYSGWPRASSAIMVAREFFRQKQPQLHRHAIACKRVGMRTTSESRALSGSAHRIAGPRSQWSPELWLMTDDSGWSPAS